MLVMLAFWLKKGPLVSADVDYKTRLWILSHMMPAQEMELPKVKSMVNTFLFIKSIRKYSQRKNKQKNPKKQTRKKNFMMEMIFSIIQD